MEQSKQSVPKLFLSTVIENKDEIEEVPRLFSSFSNKESVGHVVVELTFGRWWRCRRDGAKI